MFIFEYKACDASGKLVIGQLNAADEAEAMQQLKERQLAPLLLKAGRTSGQQHTLFQRRSVRRRDITHMTNQLSSLLSSGIPLAKAIHTIKEQTVLPGLNVALQDVSDAVKQGKPLSESMAAHPIIFDDLYRSLVKAGEVGGILDQTLTRLAGMMERDESLRAKIKGALTYPMIMLVVMLISIVVLITFVVPRFTGVFSDMGTALPWPTQILIDVSGFFQAWWWLMILVLAGAVFSMRYWLSTPDGRFSFDRSILKLPVVGQTVLELNLARFAQTMGSLIGSGVPILSAMEATADVVGNAYLSSLVRLLKNEVREGRKLSAAIIEHAPLFPSLVSGMVATGEESGNMAEMLNNVGNYYAAESDARLKSLTTLLEPAIIVVMGGLVGFIIIAMLLPIFEMTMMVN